MTGRMVEAEMLLLRFVCPFMYSMIVGTTWSLWFKKKFSSSLAPAYMTHILVVLLCGLIFKRLSIGIYGGCIIATVMLFSYVLKYGKKHELTLSEIRNGISKLWNEGGFVFTVFYVFCVFINLNKRFIYWDEFSHWGMFLKESIRLDSLYCMSPLGFAHKDYVPAITLFEVIWCKLNFRYSEPDVYRGIQIFMFSMLLPMFESFELDSLKLYNSRLSRRLFQLGAVILVLLVPLIFNTSNAFFFYHSIYCDIAVGIVFYWCVYEAYRKYDDVLYSFLLLTIGISILVLSKMTAMALMPLVIGLFVVRFFMFPENRSSRKEYVFFFPLLAVPVALWMWFNSFVTKCMGKLTDGQSYGGVKISSVKEVFTNPENSAITYLKQVKDAYIDAIIHRDILIHGSYVVVILFIIISFFALTVFATNEVQKKSFVLAGIWTLASGIYYALLMYFLYSTAFSEYEATRLASYERYMNSFVIAALLLLIAVYYDSEIWKNHIKSFYLILIFVAIDLAFLHVGAFDQVLPGNITHDDEMVKAYTDSADLIMNTTTDDDSIYIVKRGDNEDFLWHQRYYCSPRTIGGGSIGPMVYDGDIWSRDIEVDAFVEDLKGYDYIYFQNLDEAFLIKYADAFDDPTQLVNGQIYKIADVGSKVKLIQ